MSADCWACGAALPHEHHGVLDCPHTRADGVARGCCLDESAARIELVQLAFRIRVGRITVPDTIAELLDRQ